MVAYKVDEEKGRTIKTRGGRKDGARFRKEGGEGKDEGEVKRVRGSGRMVTKQKVKGHDRIGRGCSIGKKRKKDKKAWAPELKQYEGERIRG